MRRSVSPSGSNAGNLFPTILTRQSAPSLSLNTSETVMDSFPGQNGHAGSYRGMALGAARGTANSLGLLDRSLAMMTQSRVMIFCRSSGMTETNEARAEIQWMRELREARACAGLMAGETPRGAQGSGALRDFRTRKRDAGLAGQGV